MITEDEFDLDVRFGVGRSNWSVVALDPPTEADPDSHEATCGSACPSHGPNCH
ncbi:hypothetical protein [Nocardia colli]|uniref:hypothetical protein n=1 Tax=Nocardia colli TaxID=2545717 RepID=UPI00168D250A|nr:hypothetical protein [Nocardia colli]